MKKKSVLKGIIGVLTISAINLATMNISLAASKANVNVETANLRETATSEAKVVEQLSKNEEVEVIEVEGDWSKVQYKDKTGYIKTELLNVKEETIQEEKNQEEEATAPEEEQKEETPKAEEQTEDNTENREEDNTNNEENSTPQQKETEKYFIAENIKLKLVPLISATDMIEIEQGKEVKIAKTLNGWAYIECEETSTRGWVRQEKLKTQTQIDKEKEEQAAKEAAAAKAAEEVALMTAPAIKNSFVQTKTVNLRKEPNENAEILGRLPQNTEVEVLVEDGEWDRCRVNGLLGYISSKYLGDKKVEDEEEKREEEATSRGATTARKSKIDDIPEVPLSDIAAKTSTPPASKTGSAVVAEANKYIGSKYVSGGIGPTSFDCSGFTSYIYKQFGVSLPHSSTAQRGCGTAVDKSNLAPGDIILFSGHVAIYAGNNTIVHAANSKRGVTTDNLSTYCKSMTYLGARRIL